MQTVPALDRYADSTALFVDQARSYLGADDFTILSFNGEDPTGAQDMWENPKSRFLKNLCHFLALGGFLPESVKKARAENRLYVWGEDYAWAGNEGLSLPEVQQESQINWVDAVILAKPESFRSKVKREWKEAMEAKGCRFISLNELYSMKVAEASTSEEDLINYIKNVGGKLSAENWWEIKFKKYTLVEIKLHEGTWYYREGTQEFVLRNYHTVGGLVPNSKHAVMLAVLNYLLTSKNEEDLRGRRAYMSNVFVDNIYVGYSHKLLDKFNANKCGTLLAGLGVNTLMPVLAKDGNLVRAAKAYEAIGCSVFMHKGAKYIVVGAECAGFARQENKTFVGWHADKQAKLTGRNLFSVPTAGLYIDDEE